MRNNAENRKALASQKFEREIFELVKAGYPDDEVEFRPRVSGQETADVLYRRRGVELGIEVKLRNKKTVLNVGNSDAIFMGNYHGEEVDELRQQLWRYTDRFRFVYLVSNVPVSPLPIVEFPLNGSACFVSHFSELYRVIDEVVRRIDLGLTSPEKRYMA